MARNPKRTRLFLENLEARRLMSVYADFNGDGFDDLAIGVPGENNSSGMVQVLYGSAAGLTATGSQTWTQLILGTDASETGDGFGSALTSGDFDNDGYADLAIGIPGEDVGIIADAGSVHFLFGSSIGLNGIADYILHQNSSGVLDQCENGDRFGSALAAGDFDDDGFTDLAVGVPGQDLPGKTDAGAAHIFYGGTQGIRAPGNQIFSLDSMPVGDAATGDTFGASLAAADFNDDGRDDLAIGAPHKSAGIMADAGQVHVMYGSADGLLANSLTFADFGVGAGHQWGYALAAGDFNGDGFHDLAAGAPYGELAAITPESGTVTIIFGSADGIATLINSQKLVQIQNGAEAYDHWGAALAASDSNADGFDDLAVGAPDEDIGGILNTGQVDVLLGSVDGITTVGFATRTQETLGGVSAASDRFGSGISWGDFNNDGLPDLVVGTPGKDVGAALNAGAVYVLYRGSGPAPQIWNQDSPGIFDTAESSDRFGGGLDTSGGKSAPGGGNGCGDVSQLITADFELDTTINTLNKRRNLRGRR
jgi:hypothetical protein